uniref:Large ribosomal subunit protein uL6c n=1 Tax=Trichogloeopsis pedicellata TaxID=1495610 RepID=A0A1G4P0Q0_9FLOR|nr:Ribosomal protein L6 [Trichogloeopsis pedicellata]SCW24460.1 Ribosomal protein L6 [Trichogloeopsis pedicellata]
MSRIGKKEIILSSGIEVSINKHIVTVKGPKGQLQEKIADKISIQQLQDAQGSRLILNNNENSKEARELHGLSRTLINNMVIGVKDGFTKRLEIRGVGYRSQMDSINLILNVGYSHPVILPSPHGINIKVENNTNIIVSGIDKQLVGQTAAKIRAIRPPEPYKGKGIRYKDEIVKKKIGKAGK